MVNQNENGTQMTIVKAKYGSDIRKLQLCHNNDLSLNDIIPMMQRLFNIKDGSSIQLKYRDEENDLITIAEDNDLVLAAQENPLFVHVFTQNDEFRSQFSNLTRLVEEFKVSIKELSSMVQKFGENSDTNTDACTTKSSLKAESPVQKLEQKAENNDNIAIIKPEQAEFSNIPLNSQAPMRTSSFSQPQQDLRGQLPHQIPYSNTPTPTVQHQYQPSVPTPTPTPKYDNNMMQQPHQQQPFAPQQASMQGPYSQQPLQPTPPSHPPVSSYQQHQIYNPTPPPTSLYQPIPQQPYAPIQQAGVPQQQSHPPPMPPVAMGNANVNPFARNPPQGFRPGGPY